jgi:hypothetical protein
MKPITKEEIQAILDSGVTKNFIEKKLKMGQGSIGKFLTGKLNSLPDKYAAGIRKIGKDVAEKESAQLEKGAKFNNIQDDLNSEPTVSNECSVTPKDMVEIIETAIPELKYQKVTPESFNGFSEKSLLEPIMEVVEGMVKTESIKRPQINKDLLP